MTLRPTARRSVLAVVALLLGSSAVRADYVTLQYDGRTSNPTITNSLQQNAPTGPFSWTQNNIPTNPSLPTPPAQVTTYCIELADGQIIPPVGTSVVFSVESLASAPTIGSTATANAITELYGRDYNSTIGNSTNQVAFQLALWELVYDGAPAAGNTTDLSNGVFNVGGGFAAYTVAQTWLNQLTGDTSYFSKNLPGMQLAALVAPAPGAKEQDSVQDQITLIPASVPAPPGLVLGGLGMITLLGFRSRRQRAAV